MLDIINIGTSGLLGNEQGLRTVGNNLANVNTTGFKGAKAQFASLFDQSAGMGTEGSSSGMEVLGNSINFQAGSDQTTGNPLDLKINGDGFFAVRHDGQVLYTRSGNFHFDASGLLVNGTGDHVLALDGNGNLADVKVNPEDRSMPKATTSVQFAGNLSSTVSTPAVAQTVNGVSVLDASGATHNLNLSFTNSGDGSFAVTVTDAATNTQVGTGTVKFTGGFPAADSSTVKFSYAPAGQPATAITLSFGANVTSLASATTLTAMSQDGYGAGTIKDQTIDADGVVNITYSNGQSVKGARLVLANFRSPEDLEDAGRSVFALKSGSAVQYGYAGLGGFGSLASGHLEGSNVDMAEEFSNLIVMQRGYQAASHVISTANDMIQELFDMKGNR
jgi:flagellar hook protein FlgE